MPRGKKRLSDGSPDLFDAEMRLNVLETIVYELQAKVESFSYLLLDDQELARPRAPPTPPSEDGSGAQSDGEVSGSQHQPGDGSPRRMADLHRDFLDG